MIEFWSQEQIKALIPKDEVFEHMFKYIMDLRSQGNTVENLDLGAYRLIKFTHVFEEYNEAIYKVIGKNLILRTRHTWTGFITEQVMPRQVIMTSTEYVEASEYAQNPGPIRVG